MRLIKKYAVLIFLWYWVTHWCGFKDLLLNMSLEYLPYIKGQQSFIVWFLSHMGGEVGLCWACAVSIHYLRKDDALIVLVAMSMGN